MSVDVPRLALVAGEASGDLLAGLLLKGVRSRWPQAHCCGIGGAQMQAQGFETWWPQEKLAVRGYLEVLRHYPEIAGIRRRLGQRLLSAKERPDVFIGVDAPDFNLGLEERLKNAGVPTVHFVSPSVWAWRGQRIQKIARSTQHMLCLFPFEPALYAGVGVQATYVGHPLAQVIPMQPDRAAARRQLGLDGDAGVVAVLPGSRRSEIEYILPSFVQAAWLLHLERADLQFVLPAIPSLLPLIQNSVERVLQRGLWRRSPQGLRVRASAQEQADFRSALRITTGQSHAVLAACDVSLMASGTATLEAALFKRPMVIAYKMNALSHQIMRRMAYQPWVGLPNILLRDFAVPELLQNAAQPQALADAVLSWLDAPARVQALQARFAQLHQELQRDTAQLSCEVLAALLQQAPVSKPVLAPAQIPEQA